jgi:hypothetical protein
MGGTVEAGEYFLFHASSNLGARERAKVGQYVAYIV